MRPVRLVPLVISLAFTSPALASDRAWSLGYKSDVVAVVSGGARRGVAQLGLADFQFQSALGDSAFLRQTEFYFQVMYLHGKDPGAYAGDLQGPSNIAAAYDTFRIYESWVEHHLNDQTSIKFGLYDVNTEFYVTPSSLLLLNSSFGVGKELAQTGRNGPSIFPTPALGLRVRLHSDHAQVHGDSQSSLDGRVYLQLAVVDAVPGDPQNPELVSVALRSEEGYIAINEFGFESEKLKAGVGVWSYSEPFPEFTAEQNVESARLVSKNGWYALLESEISEGIRSFFRYGFASPRVNCVSSNPSVGMTFSGSHWSRERDSAGVAVSHVTKSRFCREVSLDNGLELKPHETAYELTYRMRFFESLALQPTVQYIHNPGVVREQHDATLLMLRSEIRY